MSANLLMDVQWWRPYCDHQDDGPGSYAIGLPFPFAEPTGASSMEFWWMPHVYALDTLILAALAFQITRRVRLPAPLKKGGAASAMAGAGAAAVLLVALWQAFVWSTGWRPTASIPTYGSDRYIDFRPAFMVDSRTHGRCDH